MNNLKTHSAVPPRVLGAGMLSVALALSAAWLVAAQPEAGSTAPPVAASTPQPAAVDAASTVDTRAVGTITGEGTAGTIPKFTGPNTIGNSIMIQSSGRIGIGTASPTAKLDVRASGTTGADGIALFGVHSNAGGTTPSIKGQTNSTATGASGVLGMVSPATPGTGSAGVRGINNGTNGKGYGVFGDSASFTGVYGISRSGTSGAGVWGKSAAAGGTAVLGEATNGASYGVWGRTSSGYGVYGQHSSGTTGAAVYGVSTATGGNGVLGEANTGSEAFAIWGKSTSGEAGHFTGKVVINGDLEILGNLTKDSRSSREIGASLDNL